MIGSYIIEHLEKKNKEIKLRYAEYMNKIPKGHIGGALSMCECLTALFYNILRTGEINDRFVLSKGHCSQIMYCIAADKGLVSWEEIVDEYNIPGGRFGSHPNRQRIPLIEYSSGALGHGLSIAVGMALVLKNKKLGEIVYCMVGDGELNEGSNWEAIMSAAHYKLGNICILIDKNGYSSSDKVSNVMNIEPLEDKLIAFGVNAVEINGNDISAVVEELTAYKELNSRGTNEKPHAIILNTKKGNGFSKIEKEPRVWHNGHIDDAMLLEIKKEIGAE